MISLQAMVSLEKKKPCFDLELMVSSKKRKREEREDDDVAKDDDVAQLDGLELYLESPPLPLEWERCLDIKSGQIHYYNTRTHKRTLMDPRATADKPIQKPKLNPIPDLELDLELNLTCNSKPYNLSEPNSNSNLKLSDQTEMIATVCMKCHMLVMMCKSTLSCPSCKFVHPQTRNPLGFELLFVARADS